MEGESRKELPCTSCLCLLSTKLTKEEKGTKKASDIRFLDLTCLLIAAEVSGTSGPNHGQVSFRHSPPPRPSRWKRDSAVLVRRGRDGIKSRAGRMDG